MDGYRKKANKRSRWQRRSTLRRKKMIRRWAERISRTKKRVKSRRRHSDPLFRFDHKLFGIEYRIFRLLMFAFTLYGMYAFAENHLGLKLSISPPTVISTPAPSGSSPAEQTKP